MVYPAPLPISFYFPLTTPAGAVGMDIISIASDVIAKQLTEIEHSLFKKIAPHELFFANWKKKGKSELSPNIVVLINWFNRVRGYPNNANVNAPYG